MFSKMFNFRIFNINKTFAKLLIGASTVTFLNYQFNKKKNVNY